MSDLSFLEKQKFERLFGMSSGYVLSFSNRTFEEFIADSVRRNIYSGAYDYASNSKANLLRRFWELEPNHVVGKLLADLIELARDEHGDDDDGLTSECVNIVERLRQGAPIDELITMSEELTERDFELLVGSIRESIDSNEPEEGLDRLHTFVMKFLRRLCDRNEIEVTEDKPLHSLLGEYIKKMKANGAIETEMTERILKTSISNFEAFNAVRNRHSFAHDNPILNYDESLLIFSNVISTVKFIQSLERKTQVESHVEDTTDESDWELPF